MILDVGTNVLQDDDDEGRSVLPHPHHHRTADSPDDGGVLGRANQAAISLAPALTCPQLLVVDVSQVTVNIPPHAGMIYVLLLLLLFYGLSILIDGRFF